MAQIIEALLVAEVGSFHQIFFKKCWLALFPGMCLCRFSGCIKHLYVFMWMETKGVEQKTKIAQQLSLTLCIWIDQYMHDIGGILIHL